MVICKKQTHTSAHNCTNTGGTAVGSIIVWITSTPQPPSPSQPPFSTTTTYCCII